MAIAQKLMGQINANKELVRQAYDALNRGDIDEFGKLLSDDFTEDTPKGRTLDKNACLAEIKGIRTVMPDAKYEIQEIIAEEDKVVVVQEFSWTLTGDLHYLRPSDRRMSIKQIDVFRLADGKLVELSEVFDSLSMWTHLGIIS